MSTCDPPFHARIGLGGVLTHVPTQFVALHTSTMPHVNVLLRCMRVAVTPTSVLGNSNHTEPSTEWFVGLLSVLGGWAWFAIRFLANRGFVVV